MALVEKAVMRSVNILFSSLLWSTHILLYFCWSKLFEIIYMAEIAKCMHTYILFCLLSSSCLSLQSLTPLCTNMQIDYFASHRKITGNMFHTASRWTPYFVLACFGRSFFLVMLSLPKLWIYSLASTLWLESSLLFPNIYSS